MSVQRSNSALRADWLPDWLREGLSVPAPRPDEAVEALGTRDEGVPEPSVVQPGARTMMGQAGGQIDGSGECVQVQSTEGIPLDKLDQGGAAIQPPPAAHGPIHSDAGYIPIEEFLLDDLTDQGGVIIVPPDGTTDIPVDPERDRSVKRRLGGIHIFAITISGVLGIGLYVQGGTILRLAGPLAVLLSYSLLGLLAWAVMQCMAELICIWPISGAMTMFVSEFVDAELGITVGVAYWFTYSISFAALIVGAAAEAAYWTTPKGIEAGVLFFLIPFLLVLINALGIEAYGLVEVISSTFKLTFLAVIIIVMGCINGGVGHAGKVGTSDWSTSITVYDDLVVDHWVAGFFMSLSIAAFAYVGIEIPAASALEARVPVGQNTRRNRVVGRTVQFTAIWGPLFAGALYVLAGILVSLNIKWDDPRLPRMPWVVVTAPSPPTNSTSAPDSAFIIVAVGAGIRGLAGSLNIFLLFTALSCANTNLYVASRTLFALTRGLSGQRNQPFYIRWLASLGRTNRRKVPMRALMASCIFLWVPYLYLDPANGNGTSIGTLLNVLAQMGAVGVVIVWTCECWAFLRFYYCVHEESDDLRPVSMVRRWNHGQNNLPDDYPYRSHGQPFTAIIAIAGCLFILLIAGGAALWKQWNTNAFLSAYLAPICFILLWALLKFMRNASWRLVDLSNGQNVARKMRNLHQIRFRSAEERDEKIERNFWNLGGLL